jgi:hypothetical protein
MERTTKRRGRCYLSRTSFHWSLALLLVASFLGCGGLVGPPQPPPVAVTVAPPSASVPLGEPQTFTATVVNATNTAVNWSVNGIPGGNATVGTIDPGGVYTAPANLPSPVSVSVQATSMADTTKTSASLVTVTSDISVSVSPASIPVELGASRSFMATLNSAGNPNRSVDWTLSGSGCVGAACGTVDSSGTYTAPQILISPPNVSLTAASLADPAKSGTAIITVTSSFSLALAGPATITAGNTASYLATFTPAANSNPTRTISWAVAGNGCPGGACGTIASNGVYTAPSAVPASASVQIIATPQADPSKAATVSLLILPAISISVSPSAATVALGSIQTFQANVSGAQDTTVTWDVNGVVGGNPALGSILNSQITPDVTTYAAPPSMPAGGSVTVNARSNANPNVSSSVTILFVGPIGITLLPASATLAVNHTQTFTAVVNNTSNQSVTWQVNGTPGGNSAIGQICVPASNPCQPVSATNGGSVDFEAPAGLPSPNPVAITATSQAFGNPSASASVTILPHVVISILPGNVTLATAGQLRFASTVAGTSNQQVIWSVTGTGRGATGICGFIDSTGLYSAPSSPNSVEIVATSSEDVTQSGTSNVMIDNGPGIFSLSPTSAYSGSAGGFTLLLSGNNFSPSSPGPGSIILVAGAPRPTSCASSTTCITALEAADLQPAGNLLLQLQNPDGLLSNSETFVVLAPGSGTSVIPLTPGSPSSTGNDIVVVELSTNGGSGSAGNVSLNIAAIGTYSPSASSCVLGDSPVVIQRPSAGTGTGDLCVFSVSALDPSFTFTVSGQPNPDITVSNKEPLGLGILHLTVQVPSTASPGQRTLFVQNPEGDKAAGTGVIEVH